jgi:hypothetical protein
MHIAYSIKNQKVRYCHYLCLNAQKRGYKQCPTKLLNANLLENKVMSCLKSIVDDPRITSDEWDILPLEERIAIIKSIIKEVRYDGAAELLEIQLRDDSVYSFTVPKKELKHISNPPKERMIRTEPQLRQNLLLAHQIQELLSDGRSESLKQIAGWLNISQQRINQIRNFILLCPKIQNDILLLDNKAISEIPEYKLRRIIDTFDWQEQSQIWQELLNNPAK